jgi:hypothetical protein
VWRLASRCDFIARPLTGLLEIILQAVIPESGVKNIALFEKWPKTRGFFNWFMQQSINFQSIAFNRRPV